jgi:hypothetical protein
MEEKKFPIYRFSAHWDQDNYENNSTSYREMYGENPAQEKLDSDLALFKSSIERKNNVIRWIDCKVEYVEDEVWVLKWFCHLTLNEFSKDEAFESFENFVERKKQYNLDNGQWETDYFDYNKPFYCLMGAEDYWRWKICDCDECKKLHQTVIIH